MNHYDPMAGTLAGSYARAGAPTSELAKINIEPADPWERPEIADFRNSESSGPGAQDDIALDPTAGTLEALKERVISGAGQASGCLDITRRQMDMLKTAHARGNPIRTLQAILGPDPQFFMGVPLRVCDAAGWERQGLGEECWNSHVPRAHARVSPGPEQADLHREDPEITGGMMENEKPPLCVNCRHYLVQGPWYSRRVFCCRRATEKVDPVDGREVLAGTTSPTYERLELPLTDPESKFRCGIEGKFFEQKVTFWGGLFR